MALPLPPFRARSVLEDVPTPEQRAKTVADAAFLETVVIPAEVAVLRTDSPTFDIDAKRLAGRVHQFRRLTRDDDAGWQARLASMKAHAEKIAAKCQGVE